MSDDITATVYTFPDLTTPDPVQPKSRGRSFQDALADVGTGSVTYPNEETLPYGKMIQFAVKGTVAKTIVVSPYEHVAIDPMEEQNQITTVSGIEAQLDQLAKARVLPSNGVDKIPISEDRRGDYTDPYCFDDSGWSGATVVCDIATAKASWAGTLWDPDFPDDTASVLAAAGDTTSDAPEGVLWFRQLINAPYDGSYLLFYAGDDFIDIFIDGVQCANTTQRENFSRTNFELIAMSAGAHVVAWRVENVPWAPHPGNPTGGAWALYTPGPVGVATLVTHSDSSAKVFGPQADAPGMEAGRFMACLIDENINNGFLAVPGFSYSWTATQDSLGNDWPIVVPSTKVSTDLLTCFTKDLAPYVELWADPSQWLLHAAVKGDKGGSSGVTLTPGVNITKLSQKGERVSASGNLMALVRWGGGWTFIGSGDECTFIDLGSVNDSAEAIRVATDQLNQFSQQREEITVTYEPSNDSEVPYLNAALETGATVTVPDSTDNPETPRVQTITFSEDDQTERLQVVLTVGEVVLSPQERINLQLKKMVF